MRGENAKHWKLCKYAGSHKEIPMQVLACMQKPSIKCTPAEKAHVHMQISTKLSFCHHPSLSNKRCHYIREKKIRAEGALESK